MATQLDLQEQEQLDALKAFWNKYGNLITWTLVLALTAFAGWNGWNWWQRDQAVKAGAMFDELDRAAQAGDGERAGRVFEDLKARYPRTAFAQQGALIAARVQFDKAQLDGARAALAWAADNGPEVELRTVARLRLAALQSEAGQHDEALATLSGATAPGFEALVADRRGDVLLAKGQREEARAAYQAAWNGMSETLDYRRLIEAKLTALGAAPLPPAGAASPAAAGAASGAGK